MRSVRFSTPVLTPRKPSRGEYELRPGGFSENMAANAQPEFLEATYGSVCRSTRCTEKRRHTLESVVHLAVELAREGREGRKVGTLFVIGDVDNVLEQSRSLLLDPLYGHSEELLHVERPEFRETVKE